MHPSAELLLPAVPDRAATPAPAEALTYRWRTDTPPTPGPGTSARPGGHRADGRPPELPRFPSAGEALGPFTLTAELGRGAVGRVFLAREPVLADRPVVLKLTPRDGSEHLCLARLQHPGIVPVHSVQDDPSRNLRVLCMPYLGGTTLARLLEGCAAQAPERRTGRLLASMLDDGPPAPHGSRAWLERASFVRAVCTFGVQLADALQHAHERGLVHLDVKPSNVLVTADGQAMLLDFHLARPPLRPGGPRPACFGGSPGYMSPEQHAALAALRGRADVPAVDGRSDVYSLGLVLYQALGGAPPLPLDGPPPRLERLNPRVSLGLADVIHHCLEPDPRRRYATAAALADDLRRHLADRPLRGVANRSRRERWAKWRRRRPHTSRLLALGSALMLLSLAVAAVGATVLFRQDAEARSLLKQARRQREAGDFPAAVATLRRGLAAIDAMPVALPVGAEFADELRRSSAGGAAALLKRGAALCDAGDHAGAAACLRQGLEWARDADQPALTHALHAQLRRIERARAAAELHGFVDRIRFAYGSDTIAPAERAALIAGCRSWWDRCHALADAEGPALPAAVQAALEADLLDLAVLWLDLRTGLPGETPAVLAAEALDVLAEAEAAFGASCVLWQARARHAAALGQTDRAREAARRATALPPRTAWEHYALGRACLGAGDLRAAAAHLHQAVRLQPDGLWPNYYEGVCAYRRGRYEDAVAAFSACIPLAPDQAVCFYNRGLALVHLRRLDRALADFDRAVRLDPRLGAAALQRGILHLHGRHDDRAAADFRRALAGGADPSAVEYQLTLLRQRRD